MVLAHMAKRPTKRRSIKTHRNYSVEEAAVAAVASVVTVRRWLKLGLPALYDQKPMLILGADLNEYLGQKKANKPKCRLHECYCFKCRAPRAPAGSMADIAPFNQASGNLSAICETCGTMMHKRMALRDLPALQRVLDVSIMGAVEHISECTNPPSNDHF
jgi:hypothetical protein